MEIGIAGAGIIGTALAGHFQRMGHTVRIANSRGPETLFEVARNTGAVPVSVSDVASGVDLLVVAIRMNSLPTLPKDLLRELPASSPIIDTGNYYPAIIGVIDEIEGGLTESEYTSQLLGRSVIKVFNNTSAPTLIHGGLASGSKNRIALPVSGDDTKSKQIVIALLDAMGFDAVDAGLLSESWRQQSGTPVYGTDYGVDMLKSELARANRKAAPQMRDATMQKFASLPPGTTPEEVTAFVRASWAQQPKS